MKFILVFCYGEEKNPFVECRILVERERESERAREREREKGRNTSDVWVYAQICVAARLLAVETGIANKYMWIGKICIYFVVSLR